MHDHFHLVGAYCFIFIEQNMKMSDHVCGMLNQQWHCYFVGAVALESIEEIGFFGFYLLK